MKIEYIEEVNNYYDDSCGGYLEQYYTFYNDSSLKYLLMIHLNSNYDDYSGYDEFKSEQSFPKYLFGDIYSVIVNVLNNLEEDIWFYYNKSRITLVGKNIVSDYNSDSVDIKIQFGSGDYLPEKEALEKIRTLFINLIPKKMLFQFTKSMIFDGNYRTTPHEYLLRQKDELVDTINLSAFIYFMQCNLLKIEMNDLENAKNDFLGLEIRINPFFDQKATVINKVEKIFKNFKSMTIKKGKYITREDRLKRIFDVYLMIQYPTIYFESKNKKITDTMIFKELRRLGYAFGEFDQSDDVVTSSEASVNSSHIVNDKKIIEKIKKINLF